MARDIPAAGLGVGLLGDWDSERHHLWKTVQKMVELDLVAGSSGNASMRLSGDCSTGIVLITPTSRPYRELSPEDMVVIDLEGETVAGEHAPSSETATHLAIYKARGEVGAILHTHSIYASVAAVAGMEIPPILDEMVVKLGGEIRVADYAFPSTEELAQRACHALEDRNAVLLRNHGLVGVGRTRWEALEVCQLVERAAQIFVHASMLGRANPLPPEIVGIEQELFRMQRMTPPTSEV